MTPVVVEQQQRTERYVEWAASRAEANIAYDMWLSTPGSLAYSAYRAAEDRADAAQDALARLAC